MAHVHIIDSDGGKSDKDYDATESLTDSGRKPTIHSDQDLKGASSAQVRGWLRSKAVFVEGSKWPPVLVDSALDVNLYPAVSVPPPPFLIFTPSLSPPRPVHLG